MRNGAGMKESASQSARPALNRDNPSVQRILDAAFECFGHAGYHGTSLKLIAEAAGVSKALIHYHFETKEALLFELESRTYTEVAEAVTRVALSREPGLDAAMNALDELARQMIRLAPLTPAFLELGAATTKEADLAERATQFQAHAERLVELGIRQTLGRDIHRLPMPVERMAGLILSCLQGIALNGIHGGQDGVARQVEDLKTLFRLSLSREDG